MVITGTVVTGATVTTGIAIMNGVKTAGGVMIMATTVAGISVKPMSVAIVKAGAIVMIIAEKAADIGIAIKHVGRIRRSAPHPPVVPAPTPVPLQSQCRSH